MTMTRVLMTTLLGLCLQQPVFAGPEGNAAKTAPELECFEAALPVLRRDFEDDKAPLQALTLCSGAISAKDALACFKTAKQRLKPYLQTETPVYSVFLCGGGGDRNAASCFREARGEMNKYFGTSGAARAIHLCLASTSTAAIDCFKDARKKLVPVFGSDSAQYRALSLCSKVPEYFD